MYYRKKAAALKYDRDKGSAPYLSAKGSGYIAEKIIQKAAENGVEIKEDPDLVEALSKLDIYQQIPEELYKAVAELLAEIYRINKESI